MTTTLDYSNNYLFWSQAETATITLKRSTGDTPITSVTVKREDIDTSRQFFNGVALRGDELLWRVPVALLSGNDIEPQDTITVGSVIWCVRSPVKIGAGSSAKEFQCLCVKERT